MENSQPALAISGIVVSTSHVRWLAVAAYVARFKGSVASSHLRDRRGAGARPAEYGRRRNVPAESPYWVLTRLQFGAMLTTAKRSPNSCDFALITMLDAGVDLRDVRRRAPR